MTKNHLLVIISLAVFASAIQQKSYGFLEEKEAESATTGVSLSGGGIPAILAGMCVENALDKYVPAWKNATLSTVSGGTGGHAIYYNAQSKLVFPDLETGFNMTYDQLNDRLPTKGDQVYFAMLNQNIHSPGVLTPFGALLKILPYIFSHENWWSNIMDFMVTFSYQVKNVEVPTDREWLGGFNAIAKDQCALKVDKYGNMNPEDVPDGLIPASFSPRSDGSISIEAHGKHAGAFQNISVEFTEAIGFSTAFWTADIVESGFNYFSLGGILSEITGDEGKKWYTADGGTVDTTGIVNLLRRQTSRIVAFDNMNANLTNVESPISYLFGINGTSSNGGCNIQGPQLSQVFPSNLFDEVFANLTNSVQGENSFAILRNVPVQANAFLGVEAYTLDTLIIIASSTASQEAFLKNFAAEEEIKKELDPRWPTYFPIVMPTLDSNMMCLYEEWKIKENLALIQEALG